MCLICEKKAAEIFVGKCTLECKRNFGFPCHKKLHQKCWYFKNKIIYISSVAQKPLSVIIAVVDLRFDGWSLVPQPISPWFEPSQCRISIFTFGERRKSVEGNSFEWMECFLSFFWFFFCFVRLTFFFIVWR